MSRNCPNPVAPNVPKWMSEWANQVASCENVPNRMDEEDYFFRAQDIEVLWKILADPVVVSDLLKLELIDKSGRKNIKHLISIASLIYHHSKRMTVITPSVAIKKLRNIAKVTSKLANEIYTYKEILDCSISIRYLTKRATTDQPSNFIRERIGLRSAKYSVSSEELTIVELLEAFAADIDDELDHWPRRLNGLHGGGNAGVRSQITFLKKFYKAKFGRVNNEVIARLLSVVNDDEIECDRVRKVKI